MYFLYLLATAGDAILFIDMQRTCDSGQAHYDRLSPGSRLLHRRVQWVIPTSSNARPCRERPAPIVSKGLTPMVRPL